MEMTFLLAHGALGIWDEVISLTLLLGSIAIGLAFALLYGRGGDGGAATLPDEDLPPAGPLIKAREGK